MNIILMGTRQRGRVLRHFLALSAEDRMLRFGHALSDEALIRLTASLDFKRDLFFGLVRGRQVLALAHLALPPPNGHCQEAELGLSVLAVARGSGLGSKLFARAVLESRRLGVCRLFMHCLASNQAMLHIAKKAGMEIVRRAGEADAYLKLPRTPAAGLAPPLLTPEQAQRRR
ncbi:GNAT family N-acetyltransferase [Massilia sp. W12]|uniref:GNAT family N-acetyltransferase n=1 Tax=Massilia sp. W12 TaxID=3126507 RepID=UPI0030CB706B